MPFGACSLFYADDLPLLTPEKPWTRDPSTVYNKGLRFPHGDSRAFRGFLAVIRSFNKSRGPILAVLTLVAVPLGGLSATAAEYGTPAERAQAVAMIEQLGDSRFAVREAASTQLIELGLPALSALRGAADHCDPEIRYRVERILHVVQEADRSRRIAAFVATRENAEDLRLPAWSLFAQTIGDEPGSRALFAEMLRSDWDMLDAYENDCREAARLLDQRCRTYRPANGAAARKTPVGGVGAILLLAADGRVSPSKAVDIDLALYRLCYSSSSSGFSIALQGGPMKPAARKLLSGWIDSGRAGYYGLMLATKYEMEAGLKLARKLLERPGVNPYQQQYAILAIAKLGTREHAPWLEKKLSDKTVCYTRKDPKTQKVLYQSQICDVALAGLLHLSGKDPKEYGFTRIRPYTSTVYQMGTMTFDNEDQRNAALAKWKQLTIDN